MEVNRRRRILEQTPDFQKRLSGPDWKSKYIAAFLAICHMAVACRVHEATWKVYIATAYVVGATLTQSLFLAIHELSHDLMFRNTAANDAFAVLINTPLCFPFCVDFKRYHKLHHSRLGVQGVDTDLPSRFEVWLMRRGPASRFAWLCLQIVAYALRPLAVHPMKPTFKHLVSWLTQILANAVVYNSFGSGPLRYQVFCLLLSGGLHPCAGHFLSEH